MWGEIVDDLRFAARKSSRKELLNTGLAFGGLAVLLGMAGGWLLSVGIEVSDVAMDERLSHRREAAGEALTFFWLLGGAALLFVSLIFAALCLRILISAISPKRRD